MKKYFLCIIFVLFSTLPAWGISDFSTDGCSNYPDGTWGEDSRKWFHCCYTHDIAYWMGGDQEQRRLADLQLNQCITHETNSLHGLVVELGVIVGGTPYTNLSWRWGYGFESGRGYKDLDYAEKIDLFKKFDQILLTLFDWKDELSSKQISYVIGRHALLRQRLVEEIDLPKEQEIDNLEERLQMVRELLH